MEGREKHPQGRERRDEGRQAWRGREWMGSNDIVNKFVWTCERSMCVCVCVWGRKSYLARCWGLGPLTGASTLFRSAACRQPDSTKTLINLSILLSLSAFLYLSAPRPLSLLAFCFTFICMYPQLIIYYRCFCFHFSSCTGMQTDRNSQPGPNRFH